MRQPQTKPRSMAQVTRPTRDLALESPHMHRIADGSYRQAAELKMPTTGDPNRCNPPADASHMSTHALLPPYGVKEPHTFYWSDKGAWVTFNPNSKRMGFTPEYLSRHGWTYYGRIS